MKAVLALTFFLTLAALGCSKGNRGDPPTADPPKDKRGDPRAADSSNEKRGDSRAADGKPKEIGTGTWKEFTSKEGGFSVLFPADPKVKKDGQDMYFDVELPGGSYSVEYAPVSKERIQESGGPEGYVKEFAELFRDATKSKRFFKLKGYPAAEVVRNGEYQGAPAENVERLVLVKGRALLTLNVYTKKGAEASIDKTKFFDSFKFTE